MLLETVELTMSHVGLGCLTEYASLNLFSNAHAHQITAGTGGSIRDIRDKDGRALYPSYYWTQLRVPHNRLLSQFQVWEQVSVGVDARTFGGMLLNSTYVLGRPGEIPDDPESWDSAGLPFMRAGNMFIIDGDGAEPKPAVPRPATIADLRQMSRPPETVARFRTVRERGTIDPGFDGNLRTQHPIEYPMLSGRDISPGLGVTWCMFIRLVDAIERLFLAQHLWPPVPTALIDCLAVVERETCYLDNPRGEGPIQATVRATLEPFPPASHQSSKETALVGTLTTATELYQKSSSALCLASKATKVFAVPVARQSVINDMSRILSSHRGQHQTPSPSR